MSMTKQCGSWKPPMNLINKYLPEYSFQEVHSLDVAAKPGTVIAATATSPQSE